MSVVKINFFLYEYLVNNTSTVTATFNKCESRAAKSLHVGRY